MVGYPCCCSPSLECDACNNDKGPIYFEVTLSGVFEASDCAACDRYNATYTLTHFSEFASATDVCDGEAVAYLDYCCWWCFINANFFECNDGFTAFEILLSIFDNRISVLLRDPNAGSPRIIRFEKDYVTAIDCTTLDDDIPWDSNVNSPNCEGDGSAVAHIKAVSEVNPAYACCREVFYPDCTPDEITCTIANLQNDTCSDCGDLNGTYVCSRIQPQGSQNQCYVAFFPETCGMDALFLTFGVGFTGAFKATLHNFANYPSGNAIIFDSSFPAPDYASTPYAECSNWDGKVARLSGDQGVCLAGDGSTYNSGDPSTYATATLSI